MNEEIMRTVFTDLVRYDTEARQDIDSVLRFLDKSNFLNAGGKEFIKFIGD